MRKHKSRMRTEKRKRKVVKRKVVGTMRPMRGKKRVRIFGVVLVKDYGINVKLSHRRNLLLNHSQSGGRNNNQGVVFCNIFVLFCNIFCNISLVL